MRLLVPALLLIMVAGSSVASHADPVTQQAWADYHHRTVLQLRWELHNELGVRRTLDSSQSTTLYTRPMARWHSTWKVFEARGGAGVYYTSGDSGPDRLELRPTFDGILKWPVVGPATIVSRLRFEDRLEWSSGDEYNDVWRIRYSLSTKVPLGTGRHGRQFFLPLAAEGFADAGNSSLAGGKTNYRFTAGAGIVFSTRWVVVVGGMVQGTESTRDVDFEKTEVILRLQVLKLGARDYLSTH